MERPDIEVQPKKRTIFFCLLYALFVVDFISRVGINAIFPSIQTDLNLTDIEVGMMGSVVLLGMATLVLPISFLGEKYSPKKAVSISALVWSIGTLFSGIASNFHILLSARFMVGAGNAAYAPLSNSLITSMYNKRQWGGKIGIYNTAMTVGMALGAIVFANLADYFGWRVAFYTVAAVSFFLTILSLSLPDTKKIERQQANGYAREQTDRNNNVSLKNSVPAIIKNKTLLGVCMGGGLASLVIQGILSWIAIYLVREMDFSVGSSAGFISIMALVSALGYPLGGGIMDRWFVIDKRCRVFLPIICLLIAAMSFSIGFYFNLIPMILLGAFFATTSNTCYHVATQELVPSWFKSVSYGVYVLFIQFFGAVGPMLVGALSNAFGLTNALLTLQLLLVVAVVIFVITSRFYLDDFDKARSLETSATVK